ncbi:alpha/beta hydrolase-fold protein [Flammeovirga kamogawensis]|uniref:Alpha/beta hydrolase n=1 Tax=Flammeovirga kamogawensis TaxID=373891 RepID=A0ABX8GX22_9BACT|nr:alpha/beta hydrolase-fold protein [Flammeovirga kamogawensis]MBB6460807.1 putative alpha/beta superfamily hydrolase [Flammeovirga kamogawensis]QWG08158.1 hypothetical protein KM029_04260 [Flammeovirga kamogawensis]TRX69962.1 hypothetical protein EO216_18200 [Flammeovirga kamogawensis]
MNHHQSQNNDENQYFDHIEQTYYSNFLRRDVVLSIFLPHKKEPTPIQAAFFNDGQDMEAVQMYSTLNHLYDLKVINPIAVIGIHCSALRIDEYGCISSADYMNRGNKAHDFSRFVIEELIPYCRKSFNISTSPKDIAYAGFSLGGLSALDISWHYPQYFNKIGVFSGSFWWRDKPAEGDYNDDIDRIMHRTIQNSSKKEGLKFWLQTGTKDETSDRNNNGIIDSIDDTLDLIKELDKKGYDIHDDITYVEITDGEHNFYTWSAVLPNFLTWAFGGNDYVKTDRQQLAERRHKMWFHLDAMAEAPNVDIMLISDKFDMPQLGKKRAVWALLPKGWDSFSERYPVMYLHDAQNLFNKNAPFGMWGIHKVMSEMIDQGKKMIVIAIEHGDEERIEEFAPFADENGTGGSGKRYINFIVDTLVPYINRNFPSKQDRENTGIGGSSMGGLVSLYAGLYRPEAFGKYMIFSPSLWYSSKIFALAKRVTPFLKSMIYFYGGGKESETLIGEIEELIEILKDRGFEDHHLPLKINPEANHSEAVWGQEFEEAMNTLFY